LLVISIEIIGNIGPDKVGKCLVVAVQVDFDWLLKVLASGCTVRYRKEREYRDE
jgi:hypothetical protein